MSILTKWFKEKIRAGLWQRGYGVYRFDPASPPVDRRAALFADRKIDLVLDVGANEGQYALGLRRMGYRGRIHSFEPLSRVFEQLALKAKQDPLWTIENSAVGSEDGWSEINIASHSQSSSFLPMLLKTADVCPEICYIARERVRMRSLDSYCLSDLQMGSASTYLKIDAQGFERFVLQGAIRVIKQCAAVECELSLTPLYEGESDMDSIVALMRQWGFQLFDLHPGFANGKTGELLQVDAVFVANMPGESP